MVVLIRLLSNYRRSISATSVLPGWPVPRWRLRTAAGLSASPGWWFPLPNHVDYSAKGGTHVRLLGGY